MDHNNRSMLEMAHHDRSRQSPLPTLSHRVKVVSKTKANYIPNKSDTSQDLLSSMEMVGCPNIDKPESLGAKIGGTQLKENQGSQLATAQSAVFLNFSEVSPVSSHVAQRIVRPMRGSIGSGGDKLSTTGDKLISLVSPHAQQSTNSKKSLIKITQRVQRLTKVKISQVGAQAQKGIQIDQNIDSDDQAAAQNQDLVQTYDQAKQPRKNFTADHEGRFDLKPQPPLGYGLFNKRLPLKTKQFSNNFGADIFQDLAQVQRKPPRTIQSNNQFAKHRYGVKEDLPSPKLRQNHAFNRSNVLNSLRTTRQKSMATMSTAQTFSLAGPGADLSSIPLAQSRSQSRLGTATIQKPQQHSADPDVLEQMQKMADTELNKKLKRLMAKASTSSASDFEFYKTILYNKSQMKKNFRAIQVSQRFGNNLEMRMQGKASPVNQINIEFQPVNHVTQQKREVSAQTISSGGKQCSVSPRQTRLIMSAQHIPIAVAQPNEFASPTQKYTEFKSQVRIMEPEVELLLSQENREEDNMHTNELPANDNTQAEDIGPMSGGGLIDAMTSHYKCQVDSGKRVMKKARRPSQRLPSIGKSGRSQDSTSNRDLARVASGNPKCGSVDLLQPDMVANTASFNRSRTDMDYNLPDFDQMKSQRQLALQQLAQLGISEQVFQKMSQQINQNSQISVESLKNQLEQANAYQAQSMKILTPLSKTNKSKMRIPVKTKRNQRLQNAQKTQSISRSKKTEGSSLPRKKEENFNSAETDVIKLPEVNVSQTNQGTSPNNVSIQKSNTVNKVEQASQLNSDLGQVSIPTVVKEPANVEVSVEKKLSQLLNNKSSSKPVVKRYINAGEVYERKNTKPNNTVKRKKLSLTHQPEFFSISSDEDELYKEVLRATQSPHQNKQHRPQSRSGVHGMITWRQTLLEEKQMTVNLLSSYAQNNGDGTNTISAWKRV